MNQSSIYQAISAVMADIPAIGKDKRNSQQGFMYRGVDDVMNALQPALSKHGVFVVPEVLSQTREERVTKNGANLIYSIVHVKYTFYAQDGSSVTASVIGEGMDSADKSTNKAMSVAFKYACFQVFCIPTEEMADPDAETPPPSEPKQTPKSEQKKAADTSQEPPKAQPDPLPLINCEKCNNELTPYRDDKGVVVSVKKHADGCNQKFGHIYCLPCLTSLMAAGTVQRPAKVNLNEV